MNNELQIYHKILFLDLNPWSGKEIPDAKYTELTRQLNKAFYAFQPLYQVDFYKPLTPIRKYYYGLIENEAIDYLNEFHNEISLSLNDLEKKYLIHTALKRKLSEKFRETSDAIESNNSYLDALSGPLQQSKQAKPSDFSFILQFLKYSLIRIYLEIQNTYPQFVEEPLTESEIHSLFFKEPAPENSFIKQAPQITPKLPDVHLVTRKVEATFKAFTNDLKEPGKGILDYKTMIKNPQRFASFEEQLFSNGYIDENYCFRNKHGQKEEMAMLYHVLISKKYFNPRRFQPNGPIKPLDIRKFLDHRYQASLDKQFRSYNSQSEKIRDFIAKHRWLDILPPC